MRRITFQQEIQAAALLKQAKWDSQGGWKHPKLDKSKIDITNKCFTCPTGRERNIGFMNNIKPTVFVKPSTKTYLNNMGAGSELITEVFMTLHHRLLLCQEMEQVVRIKAEKSSLDTPPLKEEAMKNFLDEDFDTKQILEKLVSMVNDISIQMESLQTQICGLRRNQVVDPCSSDTSKSDCDKEEWIELLTN
jgi:hypothetical protein